MLNLGFLRMRQTAAPAKRSDPAQKQTLAQVKSGNTVTIQGFDGIVPTHRQYLQAYGLLPGRSVRVLSHNPVTIILVEHTELAFENEIARQVIVN